MPETPFVRQTQAATMAWTSPATSCGVRSARDESMISGIRVILPPPSPAWAALALVSVVRGRYVMDVLRANLFR
jgi:hypothetical protein